MSIPYKCWCSNPVGAFYSQPISDMSYTYSYPIAESKIEKAFKVIQKMMANKTIDPDMSVKEFIDLVNDIAGEL